MHIETGVVIEVWGGCLDGTGLLLPLGKVQCTCCCSVVPPNPYAEGSTGFWQPLNSLGPLPAFCLGFW